MKLELMPGAGKFYKVNFHCHTTISDGTQTPEEVKAWYKANGYSAVCFTDHEVLVDHRDLCDEDFIALHGYEVAIKQDITKPTGNFMPVYHFNLVAEKQDKFLMPRFYINNPSMPGNARQWAEKVGKYDPADTITATHYDKPWINDYLKAVHEAGFLVTYNHPQWSLQTALDYLGLEHLHAVEIINGGCRFCNDNTSLPFGHMLRSGMNVMPNGGDDNHHTSDRGWGWTMVKAPELTYDALIAAYKRGDCYASAGPEFLELYLENGEIVVKTAPCVTICLFSEGRRMGVKESLAGDLTEARFAYDPKAFGSFFRIELKDLRGNRAFSRAYRPAEISE